MNSIRNRFQTLALLAIPLVLVPAVHAFAQNTPNKAAKTFAAPPDAADGNQVPPAKAKGGGLGSFGPNDFTPPGLSFGSAANKQRLVQSTNIMISWSKDNDELRGFSQKTGEWFHLEIARQATIVPTVADDVAAVRVGDTMAAYSGTTGSWDVLQLSKGSKAVASVSNTSIKVVDNDHVYIFAAANGRWTSPDDPKFRRSARSNPFGAPSGVPRRSSRTKTTPFDQQAVKLATEFRGTGLDDTQARAKLSKAVAEAFDRRQSSQKAEAARMQEKLTKIQAAITSRDSLRERIITRRVDELLDPNIDWDAQPTATPAGSSTRQPSVRGPSTGTPIGLPGPPHLPLGGPSPGVLRVNTQNTGTVRTTWRQPSEHYEAIKERRSFAEGGASDVKRGQAELKRFQQATDRLQLLGTPEEGFQIRIRQSVEEIGGLQKEFSENMKLWKQEWNEFESQLELLRLDVEEAQVKLESAAANLSQVEKLSKANAVSQTETREAATELELAKIAMRRAEQTLAPYLVIQKELKRLNPAEFEIGSLLEKPQNTTEEKPKSP